MSAVRLAAFDVDGTLTTRDCVVPFLRRIGGNARLLGGIGARPRACLGMIGRRDRDAMKALATRAAFMGRPVDDVARAAADFARLVHERWMRPTAVEALERHRAERDVVVLVSASYEVYLDPLGELLGVDHVVGTRLAEHPSGVLTGGIDGPNCRGPEKVRRLHRLLADRYGGRTNVHVTAYGDSPGDRELLADADVAHWIGTRRWRRSVASGDRAIA